MLKTAFYQIKKREDYFKKDINFRYNNSYDDGDFIAK